MLALGSLAFASPWLLAALAALPVIWWLLRVTPPAPRLITFPAIRLLLGLTPREETPARTPWWLILVRTVLAALVIIALAHPLLNPPALLRGAGAAGPGGRGSAAAGGRRSTPWPRRGGKPAAWGGSPRHSLRRTSRRRRLRRS